MSAATYASRGVPSSGRVGETGMGTGTHLSGERERRLVEPLLLGVPDIGGDDLVEGEVFVAGGELFAVLLGLDGELAAHGVLDVEHGWVEVVDGEGLHGVFETEEEVGETGRVIKSRG